MVYLTVLILSASGILLLFLLRSVFRSRNARRIVRAVRHGFSSAQERNAKLLPDPPLAPSLRGEENGTRRPPRTAAVALQQVRTLLRQAEKALAKQDARTAERVLIRALTIQPEAKEVKAQLARLYLDTSREPKAEALYRELLQDTQEPSLYGNLGLSCYKRGKFSEACQAYEAALQLEPKDPIRMADLGRALMAARHFRAAARALERAVSSLTKDTTLLHFLAQCYVQLQEVERAEEVYRRINRLEPGNEEVKEKIASLAQVV